MANQLYNSARELFLTGSINWSSVLRNDGIFNYPASSQYFKAILVDTAGYTMSPTDKTLDIIPTLRMWPKANGDSGDPVGVALNSRTATDGAADAADITFSQVHASAPNLEAIVIYMDPTNTNVASQCRLIAYIDTAAGLPIQPNGGDIIVTWDNGANKIFKL